MLNQAIVLLVIVEHLHSATGHEGICDNNYLYYLFQVCFISFAFYYKKHMMMNIMFVYLIYRDYLQSVAGGNI